MLGTRPWDKDSVLTLMIGLFISISVGALLSTAFQKLDVGLSPPEQKFAAMIVMTLAFQGFAVTWVALYLKRRQLTLKEAFGIGSRTIWHPLVIGFVAGLFLLLPSWFLHKISMTALEYFTVPAEQQEVVQRLRVGVPPGQQIFYFFLAVLVAPLVEELLFRGILYPALKNAGYRRFALWGTSLLFASVHANFSSFLPLIFVGIAMVYLYEQTDDLLAPMIAHSVFNLVNFLAIMYEAPINKWLEQYQ